jgi:hypothetical protein
VQLLTVSLYHRERGEPWMILCLFTKPRSFERARL